MREEPPHRLGGAQLVSSGRSVAVTPHYLASRAAIATMTEGGNAVEAAIAANAVLGVVAPETCGIGGDLFALVHSPGDGVPAALNASGRAGAGAVAAKARAAGLERIPVRSRWAVTVPGCVDGWIALTDRYGDLSLGRILEPAIELATNGFPVSPELSTSLQRLEDDLIEQDSAANLYPEGAAPKPGDPLRRADLAATLSRIATEGRDAFYEGSVAADLVAATGGVLQPDDLQRRQADWIVPISVEVMGLTGWTIPPNSQGYLTLAAAWVFEQLDPPHDPVDPLFTHAAIEAYRSVAWERDDLVSDPASTPLAATALLDPDRLLPRVRRISLEGRTEWPRPAPAPGGTAYLCVRDETGMGVSLIQSNFHGIGSGIGVGSAGFFLHDRGSGFTLLPGHVNELAPGRRPLHTLSPSLWTSGDTLKMLLGTRGGDYQPQTLLQMLTYLLWSGADAPTAQTLPRWTTRLGSAEDTAVAFEPRLDDRTVSGLERLGHPMEPADEWMAGWGPVSVITGGPGEIQGAADPRVATTSAECG